MNYPAMNKLLVSLILLLTFGVIPTAMTAEELPYKTEIRLYPENPMIGDSVYIIVTLTNTTDLTLVFNDSENYISNPYHPVHFGLRYKEYVWLGAFELTDLLEFDRGYYPTLKLPPRGQRIIEKGAFQFPPLEDLHDPFWTKAIKDMGDHPEGVEFQFFYNYPGLISPKISGQDRIEATCPLRIRLRSSKEMEQVNQWYYSYPEGAFPHIVKAKNRIKIQTGISYKGEDTEKLLAMERLSELYNYRGKFLSRFVLPGNRYLPCRTYEETWKDWQDWKAIETLLEPSTMRDEIRLVRIMIQYHTTKDDAALKELSDWFVDMNDIQRTVMSSSIRELFLKSAGNEYFPSLKELYRTVLHYDTWTKNKAFKERLRRYGIED